MTVKILCDRCKREFTAEEEDAETLGELLCPDCSEDAGITYGEHLEDIK